MLNYSYVLDVAIEKHSNLFCNWFEIADAEVDSIAMAKSCQCYKTFFNFHQASGKIS
jgi:hypothetical protein